MAVFQAAISGLRFPVLQSVVESVLRCADPAFGFNQYMCLNSGEGSRLIAHSCKSKFCLRCGRVDSENFTESIAAKLHEGIDYRHVVLTIPSQLRQIFFENRHDGCLYGEFFSAGWQCIQEFISQVLGEEAEAGCLVVLHTVGRKCDYKPHLHVMLMSGGVSKASGEWLPLGPSAYKVLNRCWKKILLQVLRDWDRSNEHEGLFCYLERRYKGFVGNLDPQDAPRDPRQLLRYLSKYLCRPQISLRRLLHYDRAAGDMVYSVKSHTSGRKETERTSVFVFLGRMLQQILPKRFQRIRYYGLQSRQNVSRLRAIVARALGMLNLSVGKEKENSPGRLSYGTLVERWWNYNPMDCPACGERMELVRIWKPTKGFKFNLFRQLFGRDIGPPGELPSFFHARLA